MSVQGRCTAYATRIKLMTEPQNTNVGTSESWADFCKAMLMRCKCRAANCSTMQDRQCITLSSGDVVWYEAPWGLHEVQSGEQSG